MAQISSEQAFSFSADAVSLNSTVLHVQQNLASLGETIKTATQSFSQLVTEQNAALQSTLTNKNAGQALSFQSGDALSLSGMTSVQDMLANLRAEFNDSDKFMEAFRSQNKTDDKKVKTWRDGLIESWSEYAKVASDTYTQVKAGGEAAFKELDKGLVNFVKTGKLNLSNFAESALSMLAQVALKASLVEGVNAVLGFFDISTATDSKDKSKDKENTKSSSEIANTQLTNKTQEDEEQTNNSGKTWKNGLSESWKKYADSALDSYSIIQSGGEAAFAQLDQSVSNFVKTGKLNFSGFAESVLSMLAEIAVKSALVQGVNAVMGFFGVTANAKGGVYASSSLSAYSGQIVDRPTLFAFAKGAGLMGEAGPEAIMPLTRNANGVLGVRAVGTTGESGSAAPQVNINIASDGRVSQTSTAGLEQFGSDIGSFVDQRFKSLLTKELGQGRMLSTAMKGRRS